jgi:hypothetical protein
VLDDGNKGDGKAQFINPAMAGPFLKVHGYIEAQREIELKDAFGTGEAGGPKGAVLDFNFSLRSA